MKRLWIIRSNQDNSILKSGKTITYFIDKMQAKKVRDKMNRRHVLSVVKAESVKFEPKSREYIFFDKKKKPVNALTINAYRSLWRFRVSPGPDHYKW